MGTKHSTISTFKISLLVLVILLGGLVFSGCRAGLGAVPKGWSGATIADDILFVGSMEGKLVATNTTDNNLLWAIPLETTETGGGFGCAPTSTAVAIYGSPVVAEDEGLVYVGGYNGKIYAFNTNTGALRWVYPRQDYLKPIVGGPVVALGNVYFASADGKIYALDAETGDDVIWEEPFETNDKIWSTPAIGGDTLYIGSFDKKLYALNATDGSKKWEFETEGTIVSTPLIYENTVYIGSFDRYLYAIDASTGKQIWKFPANEEDEHKPGNWFWAKPVVYNDTIYAACLDGKVYVLKANNGEKLDEFELGGPKIVLGDIKKHVPVSSSPVLVDNLIIVATEDGMIYALDTDSNQQRQMVNLEEKVYAPLVASEGRVYIHTSKDALYEIDVQSGARREFDIK
ncbi:PQQ-binding-like beta-propeller repeat protein [Chloroflexota bacterium]